jgi:hypothetical protein
VPIRRTGDSAMRLATCSSQPPGGLGDTGGSGLHRFVADRPQAVVRDFGCAMSNHVDPSEAGLRGSSQIEARWMALAIERADFCAPPVSPNSGLRRFGTG